MNERWVTVPGGELRVRHHAPPQPLARVLLIHGAFSNGHLWDGVIDHLVVRHNGPVEIIVPDLPLGSHHRPLDPNTDLSVPALAQTLLTVLEAVTDHPVVVSANDSGGAITRTAMDAAPDRFAGALLTATETSDNLPPTYFNWLYPLLRHPAGVWMSAQTLRFDLGRRLPLTLGHLLFRHLAREEAELVMGPLWRSAGARDDMRRYGIAINGEPLVGVEARAHMFTAPVHVAWSAADRVFPDADADRIAESYPAGRRVADILDSGSLSPLDQPAQVAARLLDLLDEISAGSGG